MVQGGGDPREIAERRGLQQISDPAVLSPAVEEVIAANAGKAEEYRKGKVGLLGFFVGQVMARTGGKANAEVVRGLVALRLPQE
jgi:Asp-tRNA(Asn)/Glu-tRNA(Gln) amidotransferase B subunit